MRIAKEELEMAEDEMKTMVWERKGKEGFKYLGHEG